MIRKYIAIRLNYFRTPSSYSIITGLIRYIQLFKNYSIIFCDLRINLIYSVFENYFLKLCNFRIFSSILLFPKDFIIFSYQTIISSYSVILESSHRILFFSFCQIYTYSFIPKLVHHILLFAIISSSSVTRESSHRMLFLKQLNTHIILFPNEFIIFSYLHLFRHVLLFEFHLIACCFLNNYIHIFFYSRMISS